MTKSEFSSNSEVSIVLGIEADCYPDKNDYWRMGYSYPLQLTQWALASATGHPILFRFMETLQDKLNEVASRNRGDINALDAAEELRKVGPLSLTGPVAISIAAMNWLDEKAGLRWNALTGLLDGGRSKLVDDVLVLPITGFRYVANPVSTSLAMHILSLGQSWSWKIWQYGLQGRHGPIRACMA